MSLFDLLPDEMIIVAPQSNNLKKNRLCLIMKKIAFCFLIYDKINHEEAWNLFFKGVDRCRYNIYIHYKENRPLKYFEEYKMNISIETKYADISIVYAQNILFLEALEDQDNQHFILLSGACIPLKSFDVVYNTLDSNYSYFNITPQEQCFPRCNGVLKYISREYIRKASQWCILNRKHTQLMLDEDSYLDWFKDISAPDEHCYITNIHYKYLSGEIKTTNNIAADATTFTNWEGMDYPYPSTTGLKSYQALSNEELSYLLNSKSLFGRKFQPMVCLIDRSDYIRTISTIFDV